MRHRSPCWAVVLVVAAGGRAMAQVPAATPVETRPEGSGMTPAPAQQLALPARLASAAGHPDLPDLTLFFALRNAAAALDVARTTALAQTLLERYPDSIWAGRAQLDVRRVRLRTRDPGGAQKWLDAAADAIPDDDGAGPIVALERAEVAHELGDDEGALEVAAELRDARPGGLVVRRARRLVERIRQRPDREPSLAERLAEADLRLSEGDAQGAQAETLAVLAAGPTREARDHALWIQARAAWALGTPAAAEALCLALAT